MKGLINAIKWEVILDFKEYLRYRIRLLMDFIRIVTGDFQVALAVEVFCGGNIIFQAYHYRFTDYCCPDYFAFCCKYIIAITEYMDSWNPICGAD